MSFGSIILAERISRQIIIEGIGWISVIILMKVYNKKDQAWKKKKCKMCSLKRKGAPVGKMELMPGIKEINLMKSLMLIRIK